MWSKYNVRKRFDAGNILRGNRFVKETFCVGNVMWWKCFVRKRFVGKCFVSAPFYHYFVDNVL